MHITLIIIFYYCLNRVSGEIALGARTVGSKDNYTITSSQPITRVAGVGADSVCQSIGLPGYTDPNAWSTSAYSTTAGWRSWAK